LRFDVDGSAVLPQGVKERLKRLAGARMTTEGVLVLFAQEHRSQVFNREAARGRLETLLRRAAVAPKRRRPTRPTLSSRLERLQGKARRSGVKTLRGRPAAED
jgi:ribosome-associated protein